jgi:hypothetical protein
MLTAPTAMSPDLHSTHHARPARRPVRPGGRVRASGARAPGLERASRPRPRRGARPDRDRDPARRGGARQPDKYHRTITEGWAALVAHHLAEAPELTFDEFCARFPGLLDPTLLGRHYSRELLADPAARARTVAPDLRPLPTPA